MGYKVNLIGICLGVIKEYNLVWYVEKQEYVNNLLNDIQVCEFFDKCLVKVFVSKIVIECFVQNVCIMIYIVCFGIVIGKKGEDVDCLCCEVSDMMGVFVYINIEEVCKLDLDVCLVVQNVVGQLECCVMFCCVMKCVVQNVMC